VLDVHALDDADPFREVEPLRFREGLGRIEAAVAFPDERRVEAFLDRRPDREGRCEVVPVDHEVGAVTHCDLVDRGEEMVGGVPREDVRKPRLDAHAHEREQPAVGPALVLGELPVAELDVRVLVGALRVGLGERHRHVEVRTAGLVGRREDLLVEARVGRVQHRVGTARLDRLRQ